MCVFVCLLVWGGGGVDVDGVHLTITNNKCVCWTKELTACARVCRLLLKRRATACKVKCSQNILRLTPPLKVKKMRLVLTLKMLSLLLYHSSLTVTALQFVTKSFTSPTRLCVFCVQVRPHGSARHFPPVGARSVRLRRLVGHLHYDAQGSE